MNIISKRKTRFDQIFDLVVNTIIVIAILVVVYPLYFIVIASISDPDIVMMGKVMIVPKGISFKGYEQIFKDSRIWLGYSNTIIYTLGGTFLGIVLTITGGYALSRRDLPGCGVVMKIMVFTMYFHGGLIPTYLVVKQLHLTNTPYVLIILGSFSVFNLIITRTFFQSTIPNELLEAAFIDGCSNGKFFFYIVLPLSKAIISVIALYYAVNHWNAFFNALIYVSEEKLYPLQLILRDILISSKMVMTDSTDIEAIMQMQKTSQTIKYGVIIVSSLPVLIAYPFLQKYFVKGVMIGAIKG